MGLTTIKTATWKCDCRHRVLPALYNIVFVWEGSHAPYDTAGLDVGPSRAEAGARRRTPLNVAVTHGSSNCERMMQRRRRSNAGPAS